jgi:hypothetical protein
MAGDETSKVAIGGQTRTFNGEVRLGADTARVRM